MTYLARACPICHSANPHDEVHSARRAEDQSFADLRPFWSGLFKEKLFFTYSRCSSCGLLYTPYFFTDDQLSELYAQMAPNMDLVPTTALEATQRSYFDVAAGVAPLKGGYLEIGPDIGMIAAHAARDGDFEKFWLFEPNRHVHNALRSAVEGHETHIVEDMTDLSTVPDRSIGLAVMVHVLDHLIDPIAMLAQIRMKLRADGALFIVTHNEKSALRYVMGTRWPPFCLQHPEVYNPASIKTLLKHAEFGYVSVERSKNYFPISFMLRQAAWRFGISLDNIPLPNTSVGLKLGNIATVAKL